MFKEQFRYVFLMHTDMATSVVNHDLCTGSCYKKIHVVRIVRNL